MFLFATLLACVTKDNFNDQFVSVVCARTEECNKGDFDALYDDVEECIDEGRDNIDEDDFEDCDFNAEAGASCLADIREADCEDFSSLQWGNDCDEVWDCNPKEKDD